MQRLHLWATREDLGFQYMNPVTERMDRDRQQGRPSPFYARINDLLGGTAGEVLATFRLGNPTRDGVPSPRRSVEEVLR